MEPGFQVRHDPIRQRVLVYRFLGLDDQGRKLYTTRGHFNGEPAMIHAIEPGNEPPVWDWFPDEVSEALGKVLSPRPEFSERHLEDALTIRDRLLTLLESDHLHEQDDPGAEHITTEADRRRTREARR